MDSIKTRVAYLNGLIDGLGLDRNTKEGKILYEMSSILKQAADELEGLKFEHEDLEEYVDAIDEDLSEVEDELYCEDDYDEYDDDDDDDDNDDCDCDCDCDDDFDDYLEVKCPNCNETVYIDKTVFEDEKNIDCPNCHKLIEIN